MKLIRKLSVLAIGVTLVLGMITPSTAITDGALDHDGHPYVGIMIADYGGGPAWRCSGTLISPTMFVTAGHCTEDAEAARVWFDPYHGDFADNGYPFAGGEGIEGTPYLHPGYNVLGPWFEYDLGVVILDTPVYMETYGELPELGVLNAMAKNRGQQDVTFTAVGYGLQKAFPDAAGWKDVYLKNRLVAYPKLNQINTGFTGDSSILLSNNAHTGGTCFGDSGGPNFIGDSTVMAGVTSYGLNPTCAGVGGVYRLDTADDLDWLYGEFGDEMLP